jgi:hypothetical protein
MEIETIYAFLFFINIVNYKILVMPNLSLKIFNYLKFKEGVKNVAYTLPGEGYPTVGIGHHAKDLIAGKFYTDA